MEDKKLEKIKDLIDFIIQTTLDYGIKNNIDDAEYISAAMEFCAFIVGSILEKEEDALKSGYILKDRILKIWGETHGK